MPEHFFRFEVGIQSTYEPTNRAVNRKQNFALLAANLLKLMDGKKVDLHLDLIAGLPYESFDRFAKSFDDVFELKAKEVQLGFLKMLRGTSLRHNAAQYGYVYKADAPYEIEYNSHITPYELDRIHHAEHALEKYWNSDKFRLTMNYLFDNEYKGRYFAFFDAMGQFYKSNQLAHHGYQLEDLFRYLHHFLSLQSIDLFLVLRKDYYSNFSRRPHGFWIDVIDKKTRKRILYEIGQDKVFLKQNNLTRNIIEKHTAIDVVNDTTYLLTIFLLHNDVVQRLELNYELVK